MGPAHICNLTDIWVGPVADRHINTCPVETVDFSLYRDDGLDILKNGEMDLQAFNEHLDSLHPNSKWET